MADLFCQSLKRKTVVRSSREWFAINLTAMACKTIHRPITRPINYVLKWFVWIVGASRKTISLESHPTPNLWGRRASFFTKRGWPYFPQVVENLLIEIAFKEWRVYQQSVAIHRSLSFIILRWSVYVLRRHGRCKTT